MNGNDERYPPHPDAKKMPCMPDEIPLCRYLPDMKHVSSRLYATVTREMAYRILTYSADQNAWVGVNAAELLEAIQKDITHYRIAREATHREYEQYEDTLRLWTVFTQFTFGFSALVLSKPEPPDFSHWSKGLPNSCLYTAEPGCVADGIRLLKEQGKVLVRNMRYPGDNGPDQERIILFPTPFLVEELRLET